MLRFIRRRRSVLAAIAAGLMAVPSLFGGVAAAPAEGVGSAPPDSDPSSPLPPDPVELQARLVLAEAKRIGDLAPHEFRNTVAEIAHRHRVDPRLVAAVITVETDWNPDLVGLHGELGLMQILPTTGTYLARLAGLATYDLTDPATNVELGTWYLAELISQYGDLPRALAAYNGGPSAVDSWETNLYARKVLKLFGPKVKQPIDSIVRDLAS